MTNSTEELLPVTQDKRRDALIERIGTIADLACSKPLEGELGDVAYDLLRQAAAQIASDRNRLNSTPAGEGRPALPREAEHLPGCNFVAAPIWLCECPRPIFAALSTPPAPAGLGVGEVDDALVDKVAAAIWKVSPYADGTDWNSVFMRRYNGTCETRELFLTFSRAALSAAQAPERET